MPLIKSKGEELYKEIGAPSKKLDRNLLILLEGHFSGFDKKWLQTKVEFLTSMIRWLISLDCGFWGWPAFARLTSRCSRA